MHVRVERACDGDWSSQILFVELERFNPPEKSKSILCDPADAMRQSLRERLAAHRFFLTLQAAESIVASSCKGGLL
jgi:hypothetical protein